MKLAVGFLVAYDYELLYTALPLVYSWATDIILSMDEQNRTWSGKSFLVNSQFKEWVKNYDTNQKITWQLGNYYKAGNSPMENETLQRNHVFAQIPNADWYIQLDADEYFLGGPQWVLWLQQVSTQQPTMIMAKWKTIYKKTNRYWFVVGGKMELVPVATNFPRYTKARHTEASTVLQSPGILLHQSWARSESSVNQKITNWGHSDEIDAVSFLKKWKNCNRYNYLAYRHFHPLHSPLWPYLECIAAKTIEELIDWYTRHPPQEGTTPTLPIYYRIFNFIAGKFKKN